MKLIDKDALVAEIEKLINEIYNGQPFDSLSRERQVALWYVKSIMSSVNSLEVKEVDLEDEIEKYVYSLPHSVTGTSSYVSDIKSPIARDFGVRHDWSYKYVEQIAKHFFELGLKAQKGEKV